MFWNLLFFRGGGGGGGGRGGGGRGGGRSTRHDERSDLFYSAGPHSNLRRPEPTQEKLGRGFGEEMNVS